MRALRATAKPPTFADNAFGPPPKPPWTVTLRTRMTPLLTLITTVTAKKYDFGVWRGRTAAGGAALYALAHSMIIHRVDWVAVASAGTAIVAAFSPDARDPSGIIRAVPPTVTETVEKAP